MSEESGFALWHIEAATFNQAFFQSHGQKLDSARKVEVYYFPSKNFATIEVEVKEGS